jgi:hypothetical protein
MPPSFPLYYIKTFSENLAKGKIRHPTDVHCYTLLWPSYFEFDPAGVMRLDMHTEVEQVCRLYPLWRPNGQTFIHNI